jgi:hypothetical protein
MEPMHWEYLGALGGVIGIGWLVVVPMYRGWNHLNERMTDRVTHSITLMAELELDRSRLTGLQDPRPYTGHSTRR